MSSQNCMDCIKLKRGWVSRTFQDMKAIILNQSSLVLILSKRHPAFVHFGNIYFGIHI